MMYSGFGEKVDLKLFPLKRLAMSLIPSSVVPSYFMANSFLPRILRCLVL